MASSITAAHIVIPTAESRIPAVILAGGLARRMGGADKPLLRLGGPAVLDHVLAGLRPQVGAIAINANGDPARFAAWGLPVLADPVAGFPGPLAGVLAGMLWARDFARHVLSWPGDTPYPPADLMARLGSGDGVACAASGGRIHPVVAVWPVALAPMLRARLLAGDGRVAACAEAAGLRVEAWESAAFVNLNRPEDLQRADPPPLPPAGEGAG